MNLDRDNLARTVRERFRAARERGKEVDEAVTEACNIPGGPNLSNFQQHFRNALTAGLMTRQAVAQAIEATFGTNPRDMPTERQQMTRGLAARFAAELAMHGDPQRAATTAAAGLPGRYHGVAHHLAAAAAEGMEPDAAAAAAVETYFGGGGQPFGHAMAERSDLRPVRERKASRRTWDQLTPPERSIVANFMVRDGRPGEQPTSADIDAAFEALSNQR